MKQANAADILFLIRECGQITRKQIEALTGLSWAAVSGITARLIEHGYITECKSAQSTGAGRTPFQLEINGADHFVIGLDVNSSGLRAVLINLKNTVLQSWSHPADFTSRQSLLNGITALTKQVLASAGKRHILGVGVAMQGLVDAKNGISIRLPQCKNWSQVPLAQLLQNTLRLPVFLEHDPNCILYARTADSDADNAILLRVDNGIGMAVMLDGRILDRPGMFELGHTTAVPDGPRCDCGRNGCLELYASQSGMAQLAQMPFAQLAQQARAQDSAAKQRFADMARHLATALCNAAHLLHIPEVVLCGDMWNYNDLFYDAFIQHTARLCPDRPLCFSTIDVENAALGAALIALERSISQLQIGKEDTQ